MTDNPYEYSWFNVQEDDEEGLKMAKQRETFESFAIRNHYPKIDENTKLDFLIYKESLSHDR